MSKRVNYGYNEPGLRVERVAVSGWDHVGGSARTRGDAWKRRLAFWWAGVPGPPFLTTTDEYEDSDRTRIGAVQTEQSMKRSALSVESGMPAACQRAHGRWQTSLGPAERALPARHHSRKATSTSATRPQVGPHGPRRPHGAAAGP